MNPLRLLAASGSLALLAGCVTASQTVGRDGRVSYVINCPGVQHSMSDCYSKADKVCGVGGYSVLSEDTDIHLVARPADSGLLVNTNERTLIVACNADATRDPAGSPSAPATTQP